MKKNNRLWTWIHWIIVVNFLIQIAYGSYMVFFEITPPGHSGPLFGASGKLDPELMMVRRAYALETWVALAGLSIYLAITEIGPRRWQRYMGNKDSAGPVDEQ